MTRTLIPLASAAALAIAALVTPANQARAQAYPIDCAILLCLSGGWPASVPCTQARAEFIRRITPWPVEPPLQIWRCPMRASNVGHDPAARNTYSIDIRLDSGDQPAARRPALPSAPTTQAVEIHFRVPERHTGPLPEDSFLLRTRDQADIDISDQAFDFVRSIRVYHVQYARQRESGKDGDCNRTSSVVLGTYGPQGSFAWRSSSLDALPADHVGLNRWGETCPTVRHRSVFVEWRDGAGAYGYEQVNY